MAGEKLQSSGKRKCQPKCPEHQFNLQPKSTKCWLKNVTNIDFCPLYNDALSCYENIVPVFNQDEQQCLPGFILEVDRNDYIKSMQKYKEDHQKKVQEYTTKKTKLQIPKPGRKHRYCGVCRKPYDDYLDHIKSADHINCFNRHEFVHVILKIVSEDYKSKDENKLQNDICFDVVTSAIPKKRGPKPKNPGQQAEPKKRGRKPAEPSLTKRIKTQPVQEQFNPYRPQPPPYFPQHIIFPYPPPLNQMIAQIPFQQLVNLPFQIQFGQEINIERKIEDMSKIYCLQQFWMAKLKMVLDLIENIIYQNIIEFLRLKALLLQMKIKLKTQEFSFCPEFSFSSQRVMSNSLSYMQRFKD